MKLIQSTIALCGILLCGTVFSQEIGFEFEGVTYKAQLLENDATKELMKRLPLAVAWENLGKEQRIAYLQHQLRIGKSEKKFDAKVGDLAYFILRKNLAVFYVDQPNAEYYVPLGHLSEEALKAVRGSESKQMIIRK